MMLALSLAAVSLPYLVKKSFAVETLNVDVYWNSDCTQKVESIEWGSLTPGSTSEATVFVRNEDVNSPCVLHLSTANWVPLKASRYIELLWDYDRRIIEIQEILPTTLKLRVASNIHAIAEFNFDIIISGTEYIIGDVNHDGSVDIYDIVELVAAYGSTPSDPNWNPWADLNGDNVINIYDIDLLTKNYPTYLE